MRHLLGGVPAPIIFGFIKDYLAPACEFNPDGGFINEEDCKDQQKGILITLALSYAFLGLSVLCFLIAYWFVQKNIKIENEQKRIAGAGKSSGDSSNLTGCDKVL